MIGEMPEDALRPTPWTPPVVQDAKRTAEDICKFGDLADYDDDDLRRHVVALARAAVRFPPRNELRNSLNEYRSVVATAGVATDHADILRALNAVVAPPSGV